MTPINKLKLARALYDESQEVFGSRVGYSQSWISQMEEGKKPIPKTLSELLNHMIKEKEDEDEHTSNRKEGV